MIVVSGFVGKAPTSTKNGDVLYANFPLVINVGSKELPKTQWYGVSAAGKTAEVILNHVNVGDKLFITGRPSIDMYLGKDKQIIGVQKIWLEKFDFGSAKNIEDENHIVTTPELILETSTTETQITVNNEN